MKKIVEVRNDYVDDENLCYIDAWRSHDADSGGESIAVVDLDTGKVVWKDNGERSNPMVLEAIAEVQRRGTPLMKQAHDLLRSIMMRLSEYERGDEHWDDGLRDEIKGCLSKFTMYPDVRVVIEGYDPMDTGEITEYAIHDESGQAIESEFGSYEEAEQYAEDNGYIVVQSFHLK